MNNHTVQDDDQVADNALQDDDQLKTTYDQSALENVFKAARESDALNTTKNSTFSFSFKLKDNDESKQDFQIVSGEPNIPCSREPQSSGEPNKLCFKRRSAFQPFTTDELD